jgi:hypothetical protein
MDVISAEDDVSNTKVLNSTCVTQLALRQCRGRFWDWWPSRLVCVVPACAAANHNLV